MDEFLQMCVQTIVVIWSKIRKQNHSFCFLASLHKSRYNNTNLYSLNSIAMNCKFRIIAIVWKQSVKNAIDTIFFEYATEKTLLNCQKNAVKYFHQLSTSNGSSTTSGNVKFSFKLWFRISTLINVAIKDGNTINKDVIINNFEKFSDTKSDIFSANI